MDDNDINGDEHIDAWYCEQAAEKKPELRKSEAVGWGGGAQVRPEDSDRFDITGSSIRGIDTKN